MPRLSFGVPSLALAVCAGAAAASILQRVLARHFSEAAATTATATSTVIISKSTNKSNLHHYDHSVASAGIAAKPGELKKRRQHTGAAYVFRIVLTGGTVVILYPMESASLFLLFVSQAHVYVCMCCCFFETFLNK
jgi:hypothetical protein